VLEGLLWGLENELLRSILARAATLHATSSVVTFFISSVSGFEIHMIR